MSVKIVTPSDFGSSFDTTTVPTEVNLKYATASELVAGTPNRVANVSDVEIRSKLWASGQTIVAGDRRHVTSNGLEYVALSNHTASAGDRPGTLGGESLWKVVNEAQYWEPSTAYKTGDVVKMFTFGVPPAPATEWYSSPTSRREMEQWVKPLRWVAMRDHTSASGNLWSDSNAPCIRTELQTTPDGRKQIVVHGRGAYYDLNNPFWRLHDEDRAAFLSGADFNAYGDRPAFGILLKHARRHIMEGSTLPFAHAICFESYYPTTTMLEGLLEGFGSAPPGEIAEVLGGGAGYPVSFRVADLISLLHEHYLNPAFQNYFVSGGEDYTHRTAMYGLTGSEGQIKSVLLSYWQYVVQPAMVEFYSIYPSPYQEFINVRTYTSSTSLTTLDFYTFFESYMGY